MQADYAANLQPAASDLRTRRQDLLGRIHHHKSELQNLVSQLHRIEGDIASIEGSRGQVPLINDLFAQRLQACACSLNTLVEQAFIAANTPLTSQAVAAYVIATLDLEHKRTVRRYVTDRVCVCLWMLQQKGILAKAEPNQHPQLWSRSRAT